MSIPMVDLKVQYEAIKEEINAAVLGVLESTAFILGPQGKALEQAIAAYQGVPHAIGCASGTDALHLALRALGIGPGDEVITTPFTFIATAEAISYVGATPVFVDIRPDTFNIDAAGIEAKITKRTRAILPVHLYGQAADMDAVMALAKKHGLKVVEDCAQSMGSDYKGRRTGSIGDVGCFSFFPSKNLGCYGDGGMVICNDGRLAERILSLRNHGSKVRYFHDEVGYNSRLDELQAAILNVKFKHIEAYNQGRKRAAAWYARHLAGAKATVPFESKDTTHVFHQYTLRVQDRDAVKKRLDDAKMSSMIYYPVPLHLQKAYQSLGMKEGSLPAAELAAKEVLSLPIYPELTEDQVRTVAEAVKKAL